MAEEAPSREGQDEADEDEGFEQSEEETNERRDEGREDSPRGVCLDLLPSASEVQDEGRGTCRDRDGNGPVFRLRGKYVEKEELAERNFG